MNKFEEQFNSNMSTSQARRQFFSLWDKTDENERNDLEAAYRRVFDGALIREVREAQEGFIFS